MCTVRRLQLHWERATQAIHQIPRSKTPLYGKTFLNGCGKTWLWKVERRVETGEIKGVGGSENSRRRGRALGDHALVHDALLIFGWALLFMPRPRPQLVKGVAADNTSAASEREVAIAVLSQLVRRAEVLDKTARALAL